LAAVRAALVVGSYAVVSVEVLSAINRLNRTAVLATWLMALASAGCAVVVRRRTRRPTETATSPQPRTFLRGFAGRMSAAFRSLTVGERCVAGALGVLVIAELVLALAVPPNTWDSQTYHLPRIEHWVQNGDVEHYATSIHRQLTYPVGGEYLLLHLRLLTGGDRLYGLVQWSAGVLCLVLVTRIAAQLGAGRRAQLLGALVVGSVPLVVLESSSTQTDLVMAAWLACLVTLVLDGVRRSGRTGPGTVVLIGLACGLVAATKPSGVLVVGPVLIWWGITRLRQPDRAAALGRVAAAGLVLVALSVAVAGPAFWREYVDVGNPLGPDYLRRSLVMQRHDPSSVLVNGLRQLQTLTELPIPSLNAWTAARVEDVARALHVDPSDPAITFDGTVFPAESWYPHEDKAALPLQSLLLAVGTFAALGRRGDVRRRWLAACLILGTLLYIATFKWQPWGNRLMLFLVVLAGPLAGIWLDRVLSSGRRILAVTAAVALIAASVAGGLSASYGYPRRLVGSQSVFVLDQWSARFVERPALANDYAGAAAAVKESGARRIGLVQSNDTWEYPWWVAFRGRELYSMQSILPFRYPPAPASALDAIVCTAAVDVCRKFLPIQWPARGQPPVMYAFPPGRP
jgi:4-amino-4-deoxy-L-arabinose transferase-like glycosyltransferase